MKRPRINASDAPARWTLLGERNVAVMIRLADHGNVDAGRRLLDLSARCVRQAQPLPNVLARWLADRLDEVVKAPDRAGEALRVRLRRGKPHLSKNMHAALAHESLQQTAAWAVFHAIRTGEGKTKVARDGSPTAFEIVSDWLAERGFTKASGKRFSPKTVQNWYEQQLPHMREEENAGPPSSKR